MTDYRDIGSRVHRHAELTHPVVNTRTETEAWLAKMGTKFIDVMFVLRHGGTLTENHVNDPTTIQTTVNMSFGRLDATAAVYPIDGEWEMVRFKTLTCRRFPTREAAEMAAFIIRG